MSLLKKMITGSAPGYYGSRCPNLHPSLCPGINKIKATPNETVGAREACSYLPTLCALQQFDLVSERDNF